ncbi:MAG: DUF1573 domain-containing protein [Spartobacteria bacterium]
MKKFITFVFLGLGLLAAGSAPAALTWESTTADLHPSLMDKTAVAHFKYKNTGDKPITITDVHPSCGCTTAALAKPVVEPNESGEITATFNIGDRSGVQNKTITVRTNDTAEVTTILKLTATIPKLLDLQPIFVFWNAEEEMKPKTITAKIGGDFAVTKLNVTSTDKAIETKVVEDKEKKEFQIIVTPKEEGRPINASLKIEPDFPKEAPKIFYANVRVDSRAKMPPK